MATNIRQNLRQQMVCMAESEAHNITWQTKGFSIEAQKDYVFNSTDLHENVYSLWDVDVPGEIYKEAIIDMEEGVTLCRNDDCEWCEPKDNIY